MTDGCKFNLPTMNITDTHCHFYTDEFDADRQSAVRRAIDAGVTRMILPNINQQSIAPMRMLAQTFPENMRMAMGLHPSDVSDTFMADLDAIHTELTGPDRQDYIAVGEVGIDLYWDRTYADQQMQAFERQCQWAGQLNLPVIIHCRQGLDQVLEVLDGHPGLQGVFHCFGGTADDVQRIRRRAGDWHFGIGGVVTYKNSKLAQTLPEIGLERTLLETDCPYLSPVPHRGKRNESAYIVHTAQCVAHALGTDADSVARITAANSQRLFGF